MFTTEGPKADQRRGLLTCTAGIDSVVMTHNIFCQLTLAISHIAVHCPLHIVLKLPNAGSSSSWGPSSVTASTQEHQQAAQTLCHSG